MTCYVTVWPEWPTCCDYDKLINEPCSGSHHVQQKTTEESGPQERVSSQTGSLQHVCWFAVSSCSLFHRYGRKLYGSPYWFLCRKKKIFKNDTKIMLLWHCTRTGDLQGCFSYPSPRARMCDSSSEGMKTLRNSAEKMPPFFMAPVFLMLSVTERRGWRKWNSLHQSQSQVRSRAAPQQHDTLRSWHIRPPSI